MNFVIPRESESQTDAEDLFIAVHLSHVEQLREILMTNPELINEQDHKGGKSILTIGW